MTVRLKILRKVKDGRLRQSAEIRTDDKDLLEFLYEVLREYYDSVTWECGDPDFVEVFLGRFLEPTDPMIEEEKAVLVYRLKALMSKFDELKKQETEEEMTLEQ